jgi:hypothetical protein
VHFAIGIFIRDGHTPDVITVTVDGTTFRT